MKDKSKRRWGVYYSLAYDGGGLEEFVGYYRTKLGARIARFWNKNITSWGGLAVVFYNKKEK